MPHIYKIITNEGSFAAFWRQDERTFCFFQPDDIRQPYFTRSANDWDEARSDYEARDGSWLASKDDTINATRHFWALGNLDLDVDNVRCSEIEPGIYYPRIWRGCKLPSNPFVGYNAIDARTQYGYKYIQSCTAVESLFGYLKDIFRHVEPSRENPESYGHKTRELLILICTEIESGWRAALEENTRVKKPRNRYTTVEYFRVKKPLRLGDWAVGLTDYPHVGQFSPFEAWSDSEPTKSLPWYDAYNAVKH